MEPQTAALLSGPIAVALASIGPGIGIGMLTSAYFNSVSRQPEIQGSFTTFFFVPLAMIELLGLLGFISFMLARS